MTPTPRGPLARLVHSAVASRGVAVVTRIETEPMSATSSNNPTCKKGTTTMTDSDHQDIKKLNSLLRGELSAVETYRQCIEKVDEADVKRELSILQGSHAERVSRLTTEVRRLGGAPETSSGAWGSFAKLVEGGAKVFGAKAAVAALEEGEDHGKKEYDDLDDLSPKTRTFVVSTLAPQQQRTHDALSALKQAI